MVLEEYFNYRNELLDQSKDDEGLISEGEIIDDNTDTTDTTIGLVDNTEEEE